MIYRNIREFNLTLLNATTGKEVVVKPGELIDLPEQFAGFYSNILSPVSTKFYPDSYVMEQPRIEDTKTEIIMSDVKPTTEQIDAPKQEEIKEAEETIPTEEKKKGRGRPPKAKGK